MSKRLQAAVMFLTAWSILDVRPASCTEIQASTANKAAVLGSAYNKQKELFVGQACLEGTPQSTGVSSSEFHLDASLSEKDMSSMLGLDVSGRARYGAVSTSASAHFLRDASATAFSVSSIWSSQYSLPPSVLTNPKQSPIGIAAAGDPVHWAETCGDEFVDEVRLGARLMVSVRVDFASQQQKEDFESRFSLSGPLGSLDATLKQATTEFSRDTRITIAGTQFGGDVSKLTGIFDNSVDGKEAFTKCSLGDFEKCASVIANVLDYATNTETGFPSQLAPGALPGAAVLSYHTSSYSSAAIYNDRQALVAVVLEARGHLLQEFEKQFALQVIGNRLKEWGGLGPGQQVALDKALNSVQSNLDQILKAEEVCYGDKPSDCPAAVNGLSLKAIDQGAFKLPPTPQASFRVWTSENGLLSRDESVALMTACRQETSGSCQRPQLLGEVGGQGTASIVLYLQGASLKEAHLFFEGEPLGNAIPLKTTAAPSEKVGAGWAMLVVESTRQTANWRDLDLAARRAELMQKPGFSSADGTFYVLVDDTFGRRTRFDIEYERWNAGALLRRANRWWDRAGGVVTAGTGNWTYEQVGESGMWNRGTERRSVSIQACGGGGGGGGAGGARNELMDNGGGGGGGAGSPLVSVVLWDLKATAYPVTLGTGGGGGAGGPGGGASGNGSPGAAGTATIFGPSTETMAGVAIDDRAQRWEGAPGGSGGVAPRGFGGGSIFDLGYKPDRDGKGGPGGSGQGFIAGGSGGGAESGGGTGAPSSTASGGAGGGVQAKDGFDGGGGGGGGAGVGAGGAGGNGGGWAASPGGSGGLCAGGGGGGAYGEANASGTAGGAGGGGAMEIFAVQSCPEYDLAKLRPEGCSSLICKPELTVASYTRYLGSDRVFKIGSELLYCRSIGSGEPQNPVRRDCMVIGKKTVGGRTLCSVARYFDCHDGPPGPEAEYCDMQAHP